MLGIPVHAHSEGELLAPDTPVQFTPAQFTDASGHAAAQWGEPETRIFKGATYVLGADGQ
jgi:hypothetical protein